jgi:hypothetical protein
MITVREGEERRRVAMAGDGADRDARCEAIRALLHIVAAKPIID